MRREAEFKVYLKNLRDDEGYIHRKLRYCRYAENKVGKDMEEISSSPTEVAAAMYILQRCYSQNAFDQIRAAVHTYLNFASSAMTTGWTVIPPAHRATAPFRTYDDAAGLVTYENSVRTTDDKKVSGLCDFLEREYDKIREFARNMFVNIWQDFPAIPVFLSKERPEETYFYDRESILKSIRKICAECDRENCHPPRCPAFNRMMEMELFKESIAGRYYGGTEPQIVLYFQNFPRPWKMSNPEFTAAIAKTLAHEYLHFLHDYYAQTVAKKKSDKNLREALADFFGVLYALQQNYVAVAERRYIKWIDRENTDWPYAHALKFFKKPYKLKLKDYSDAEMEDATRKFRDVFRNTINPKEAKKLLGI